VFTRMARRFDPSKAAGFDGAIVYDLGLRDGTRAAWTIEVRNTAARAVQGANGDAALTIRLPLTSFVRGITDPGGQSFLAMAMDGTMTLDGDLALAGRLGEMFGGGSTY
jgi:hypothetical protein